MNRVAKTLLNLMRIEVLLGIGLVLWVFSLEVRAEGGCPIALSEAEQLRVEAKNVGATDYEMALEKCAVGQELSDYERMLVRTAMVYLDMSPDKLKESKRLSDEKKRAEMELIQAEQERESREKEEEKERERETMVYIATRKESNDFTAVAALVKVQSRIDARRAESAVQATQINTELTNHLLHLLIEQNDKQLKQNQRIIELLDAIQRK